MVVSHDEIQLILLDEGKRVLLLRSTFFESPTTGKIEFEKRIKLDYEPEIFIDALECWFWNNSQDCFRIWEIKPELNDLGNTLRQLNKYRQIVDSYYEHHSFRNDCVHGKVVQIILLYVESKYSHSVLTEYFKNGDIEVLHCSAEIQEKVKL